MDNKSSPKKGSFLASDVRGGVNLPRPNGGAPGIYPKGQTRLREPHSRQRTAASFHSTEDRTREADKREAIH